MRAPESASPQVGSPVSEQDLHALVDGRLTPERHAEVEEYLGKHPDERARVHAWRAHGELLHELLDPVLEEPLPLHLPLRKPATRYPWRAMAASVLVGVASAGAAWYVRGRVDSELARRAVASSSALEPTGLAYRAALAHAIYSPEVRRPVEVGADQEQQLVTWLSRRLGAPVKAPALRALGYELVGGRLLPGGRGPVAQFMYQESSGRRLTIYVSREAAQPGDGVQTAFQFRQDGPIGVFFWWDKSFGYAISAAMPREELLHVSEEVYRQLTSG
jgi:anti-sigma factor RsiW